MHLPVDAAGHSSRMLVRGSMALTSVGCARTCTEVHTGVVAQRLLLGLHLVMEGRTVHGEGALCTAVCVCTGHT